MICGYVGYQSNAHINRSGAIKAFSQFSPNPNDQDTGFRRAKKQLFSTVLKTANFDPLRSCISTSDAGSQYRCGRVGRGIQPPSTPHAPPHQHTYPKKHLKRLFFHFSTRALRTDGRTGRRTDGLFKNRDNLGIFKCSRDNFIRNRDIHYMRNRGNNCVSSVM